MIQAVNTALADSFTSQTQCPHCGHKGVSGEAVCTQCGQSMYSLTQGMAAELNTETDPRNIEAAYEVTPAEWDEGSNRSGVQAVAIEAALSARENSASDAETAEDGGRSDPTDTKLSEGEQDDVRELQDRDQEVRKHEQEHISAGGGVVQGSAHYTYETGPDGKQYAVGGEVSVDVSSVPGDPEATRDKAQAVRRSALAPASPSAQDQKVAAQAAQMEAEARTEKQEKEDEAREESDVSGLNGPPGETLATESTASEALKTAAGAIEQQEVTRNSFLANNTPYQNQSLSSNPENPENEQDKLAQYISRYV